MKIFRGTAGPFVERPYYTDADMEEMCLQALRTTGLCPTSPSPVRIERFVEKHFHVTVGYEDLPEGVLGLTRFGKKGVQEIVIAKHLDGEKSKVSNRRIRSTIAHEAGHGLFHAHLYAQGAMMQPQFIDSSEPQRPKVLCRDVEGETNKSIYAGKWWEFQANRAIGAFLLPRHLVIATVEPMLVTRGRFGNKTLSEKEREKAVALLAETFDVNPAVTRIRVNSMYPVADAKQMEL
jgi:hypothetical protein